MENGKGVQIKVGNLAYNGDWKNGKMHGKAFFAIRPDSNSNDGLRVQKYKNCKINWQKSPEKVSRQEKHQELQKYKETLERKETILIDIEAFENTQKSLAFEYLMIGPGDEASPLEAIMLDAIKSDKDQFEALLDLNQ